MKKHRQLIRKPEVSSKHECDLCDEKDRNNEKPAEEDAHEPLLQRFCQSDNSFFQIRIKKIVIIHITPSLN